MLDLFFEGVNNITFFLVEKSQEKCTVIFDWLINYRATSLSIYTDFEVKLMLVIIAQLSFITYWYVRDWLEVQQKRGLYRVLMMIPIVSYLIKKEIKKTMDKNKVMGLPQGLYNPMVDIPAKGWSKTEIVDRLQEYHEEEWSHVKNGKYSGVRFSLRKDIEEVAAEGSKRFLYSNMLYWDKTGPSRQMELEVISFCNKLLHGKDSYTGMTTSGGSESIFQAILAHKRYFLKERGISKPEIVMATSAHPAFEKACEYLDVKFHKIDCNSIDGLPNMKQYKRKINSNTIMLVGSAPNLAFGTVDPQGKISELAGRYKTGFFIDGCMGSLLLPFVDDFNVQIGEEYVDLRNKNVTGMSCDIHKYGNCPKGISVLICPVLEIKLALFWASPDWVGGLYATPNIQGSRPSHTIAAAWGVMVYHGYDEYAKIAKKVFNATDFQVQEVSKIPELRIIGNPRLGNVTQTSKDPKWNIHVLGTYLNEKGWFLNSGQNPFSIYCTIHENNADRIETLVADLKDSLAMFNRGEIVESSGLFKMYGAIANIPNCIIDQTCKEVIQNTYEIDGLTKTR